MGMLDDFKAANPAYKDVENGALADALYKKYYSSIPRGDYDTKVGLSAPAPAAPAERTAADVPEISPAPMIPTTRDELHNAAVTTKGLYKGAVEDPILGLSQLLAHGTTYASELGGYAPNALSNLFGQSRDSLDRQMANRENAYQSERSGIGMGDTPDVARTIGTVASPATWATAEAMAPARGANYLSRLWRSTATGGAIAAQQPINTDELHGQSYGSEKAIDTGIGAVAGGGTETLSNAVLPFATRQARSLIDAGVPLTIGQTVGGLVQRLEDIAAGTPLVGGFVRGSLNRSTEGLNRVAINRGLGTIGEELPDNVRVGHEGVDHLFDRLGEAYDNVVPHIQVRSTYFQPHTSFDTAAQAIRDDATLAAVRPDALAHFDEALEAIQNAVPAGGPNPNVYLPGRSLKNIQSTLSGDIRSSTAGNDTAQHQIAPYIQRLKDEFDNEVARANPLYAQRLQDINEGYATATILRRAANSAESSEGVASGSQLNRAARAQDSSVAHGQFARGQANLQDLTSPASSAMRTFANSGTPERAMTIAALGAGTAYGIAPAYLAAGAAIPAMYNPVGQAALRNLAAGGQLTRTSIKTAIGQMAPGVAAVMAQTEPYDNKPRTQREWQSEYQKRLDASKQAGDYYGAQ